MIRFFLLTTFVGLMGFFILSSFDEDLASTLVLSIAGIIGAAIVLKVVVDIALFFKKEDIDEDYIDDEIEKKTKTYYSIDEYRKAVRNKQRK